MQVSLFSTNNTDYLLPIVRERIKALQEHYSREFDKRDTINVIRDVVRERCPELQFKESIELIEKIERELDEKL